MSKEQQPKTIRQQALAVLRASSFKLVKQSFKEFSQAPLASLVWDEITGGLRVEDYFEQEKALLKLIFAADIHGQTNRGDVHQAAPKLAQLAVLRAGEALHLMPTLAFTRGNPNAMAYWDMRNLLRDRQGQPVPGQFGVSYAARAMVGDIVLLDPPFSAELADQDARELIRNVFLT